MQLGISQVPFTARIMLGSSKTPRKQTHFGKPSNLRPKHKNPIKDIISKFFARKEKALIKKFNFTVQVKLPS